MLTDYKSDNAIFFNIGWLSQAQYSRSAENNFVPADVATAAIVKVEIRTIKTVVAEIKPAVTIFEAAMAPGCEAVQNDQIAGLITSQAAAILLGGQSDTPFLES